MFTGKDLDKLVLNHIVNEWLETGLAVPISALTDTFADNLKINRAAIHRSTSRLAKQGYIARLRDWRSSNYIPLKKALL